MTSKADHLGFTTTSASRSASSPSSRDCSRAVRLVRPARVAGSMTRPILGVLRQVTDHLDEFLTPVAVPAGELDQAPRLDEDGTQRPASPCRRGKLTKSPGPEIGAVRR